MIKYLLFILLLFENCVVYNTKEFKLSNNTLPQFSYPEIIAYRGVWGLSREQLKSDTFSLSIYSPFGYDRNVYHGYSKNKVSILADSLSIKAIKSKSILFHIDTMFSIDSSFNYAHLIIPCFIKSLELKYSLSIIDIKTKTILDKCNFYFRYDRHESWFLFMPMD